jgi:iron(III) transport system ATP-binding protein
MIMARVEISGVSKRFGEAVAVERLDLIIENGELISLLGPSGCGKTTTLRLLAGFLAPDEGRIIVDDQVLSSSEHVIPPERRQMSMIFQSFAVWPHKSVFDNVAFGLRLRKLAHHEVHRRVRRMLDLVRMADLGDRYPGQLSGGQQQRVALARAIVVEPKILLMDEPLSNLDANLREEMRYEIRRLHDELGITSVYVTHDQAEAIAMSHRIAVMHKGRLQQLGPPEAIYEQPETKFVARFVGRTNCLDGVVMSDGRVDCAGLVLVTAPAQNSRLVPGRRVVVSIAPYAIVVNRQHEQVVGRDMNVVEGRIARHTYVGESRNYEVVVAQQSSILKVSAPARQLLPVGERVSLSIDPAHCRVIESGAMDSDASASKR